MSLHRSLLIGLMLTSFVFALPAQEIVKFADLWAQHQEGRDIRDALERLLGDQDAPQAERFNAGYLLAVIEIDDRRSERALEILDRLESIKKATPQVAVRRAEALLISDKIEEAVVAIAAAAKMSGRMSRELLLREEIIRARIEGRSGKAKVGLERLQKLARKNKKNWELAFFSGRLAEELDDPKAAIDAYEKTIELLPKSDPCPGIYALQRWAALVVSSDKSSYGNPKLLKQAVARYKDFLTRSERNGVPEALIANVRQTIGTLEYFIADK